MMGGGGHEHVRNMCCSKAGESPSTPTRARSTPTMQAKRVSRYRKLGILQSTLCMLEAIVQWRGPRTLRSLKPLGRGHRQMPCAAAVPNCRPQPSTGQMPQGLPAFPTSPHPN